MTSPSDAVVLIGPMGAGKTSIGKKAARALGIRFFDTDAAVVRDHGPIEQLFSEHGEAHFRALEREAVVEGLATGGIVSLGGGAVLHPETRVDLAARRVVLLTVSPRVVAGRVRDSNRPLLQADDAIERWTAIFEERRPVYEELADVTFDTSSGPVQDVVDALVSWVRGADEKEQTK
ncbi:shikimate kinase [Microbacterium sp. M3]|uniref:Shikimate kinase n=1 Tax=Microbacterium arthrosphaerae TaxID=792652 RepID=A0ABU4GZL0_9MICO|nr:MULTISPECIES: shikimate kinase [Microbacterium]MDW4572521.1 shikimate kinase [Microbacterium arthrosphaerae]MDW7606376.1 shikimate kinase [Microbacterium sp. M3]